MSACRYSAFNKENDLLKWALIFAVIAIVAGLAGFTGIAGAAALANAIATHDDSMTLGLETRCRQHVRRAIRDLITDRFEV